MAKLFKSYLSIMKISFFKFIFFINLISLYPYISAEQLSAHEYAEKTHNNIIKIIQTKNQLFLEDPDLFTKEISNAFSPIVDFKRIAKNVMGKYYKLATIEQMEDFSRAFESSLLDTYASTLVEFKDEKIKAYEFGDMYDQSRNKAFIDKLLMHKIKVYNSKGRFVVPVNQVQSRMVKNFFETPVSYTHLTLPTKA